VMRGYWGRFFVCQLLLGARLKNKSSLILADSW
jgi:hypothetical protein